MLMEKKMIKGFIGKKLGMSRLFSDVGESIPVTVIQAGPCTVVQKKTQERDGYEALQLGFGEKKKPNKPQAGHMAACGGSFKVLREVKADNLEEYEVGQEIGLDIFSVGEFVHVTGTSKGRGFGGVMKRHGFSGGGATHGCTTTRSPGSIGAAAYPARVFPGKRMAGHYGVDRKTLKNLLVVDVRPDLGIILVKGAVPGPKNGIIMISKPYARG